MKKKMMKKVVSFALAMVMVLTSVLVGGVEEAKAATPEEVTLTNADFSEETSWIKGWDATTSDNTNVWAFMYSYSDSSAPSKPDSEATDYCVKYNTSRALAAGETQTIVIKQTIANLPAGKYTVSAPVSGEKSKVNVFLGDKKSSVVEVNGWNVWKNLSGVFVGTADQTEIVGVVEVEIREG